MVAGGATPQIGMGPRLNWKDRLKEALVGGLAGLSVVVAYIIVHAALTGTPASDWLSFAGAVAGSGLAVAGAVWIEHWKRNRERQAEANALLASVIRIRAIADVMLKDRPSEIPEAEWRDAINQMPENIATYARRLDRALDRLTTATVDSDVVEAADMVLRAARRVERRLAPGDPDQAQLAIASLDLLRNSCDVAVRMLSSRLNPGRPISFSEAIEQRGQKIH